MSDQQASPVRAQSIRSAQSVLPCTELQPTIDFFVEQLGFRLERISPADDPRQAWLSGHGHRLLLQTDRENQLELRPGLLRLSCIDARVGKADSSTNLVAPNGTRIEFVQAEPTLDIPPPEQAGEQQLIISHAADKAASVVGRAGMHYRDLIPGRLGGRYIASHIRIPEGGPVPDYVHFHAIRFQMIYCAKGWVRVVYEDQGPSFVLSEGDCVLQPPKIRHRVLESSPGLEVIELACPAEHDTFIEHDLELPTSGTKPGRNFDGQRFLRHEANRTAWRSGPSPDFEYRDIGLNNATKGLASAAVIRPISAEPGNLDWTHHGDFLFNYVLQGQLNLTDATPETTTLYSGDSFVTPSGSPYQVQSVSKDLELLRVHIP